MIQHNAALLRFCSVPQTTISGPLRVEQTHPFAAPLRGIHSRHKRALCDLNHVAADRSNFAGRDPVNVIKLNKIERNLVRVCLNVCISLTLSGCNHKKIGFSSYTSVNTCLYFCRSKVVKCFERAKLMKRKVGILFVKGTHRTCISLAKTEN